jgi:hypothetical protein
MATLSQHKSVRGVTCHECRAWIRGGKLYFKLFYYDYNMEKYKNFCSVCASKRARSEIKKLELLYRTSRSLIKQYKADDRKICLNCKNKFKQVVGECNPNQVGCKFVSMREKKNDNQKSKAV